MFAGRSLCNTIYYENVFILYFRINDELDGDILYTNQFICQDLRKQFKLDFQGNNISF